MPGDSGGRGATPRPTITNYVAPDRTARVTARATEDTGTARRLPDAVHAHVEWEVAVAYDQGFRDGLRAASVAMDHAITEALAGPHSYQATTVDPAAVDIVRRLVKAMSRTVAEAARR